MIDRLFPFFQIRINGLQMAGAVPLFGVALFFNNWDFEVIVFKGIRLYTAMEASCKMRSCGIMVTGSTWDHFDLVSLIFHTQKG